MTWNQLYNFRQMLEEILIETSESVESIALKLGEITTPCADENDRGSVESERSLLITQANRGRRFIEDIKQALKMIDSGKYGICSACEEDINLRRLAIYPTARYCSYCQELTERGKNPESYFLEKARSSV
jgi:DnaK suppressor protein